MPRGMRRACSQSIPGRIAAAITSPSRNSDSSTRSFHSASASTRIPSTTRVAIAAVRAVVRIHTFFPATTTPANARRSARPRGEAARVRRRDPEHIHLDARRHGIVLLPTLLCAFVVAAAGGLLASLALPLPVPLLGVALVLVAAVYALRAVWRWERTRVIVTDDQLAVVRGTLRRRIAAVRLERVGAVEVDQSLLGRLLGYGTLVAGPLEITYVPQPRSVYGLAESRSP